MMQQGLNRLQLLPMALMLLAARCSPSTTPPASAPPAPEAITPPSTTESTRAEPKQEPTDSEIEAAVERQLFFDQTVARSPIDVSVKLGVVELTGSAPHLLAKERAERLASLVRGVRSVINRIAVDVAQRKDDDIRRDISDALLADPATESFEVQVAVTNQNVTLRGSVESWIERELAQRLAEGVVGVRSVDNQLAVTYSEDRLDRDIENDVEAKLGWDALVGANWIDVSVKNGETTLKGRVGSLAEKRRAIRDARYVPGVTDVEADALDVEWSIPDGSELRDVDYVSRSDAQIEQAVRDAMLLDPRVNSFKLGVEVKGGSVTLGGRVNNYRSKQAAEQLAEATTGVIGVDNQIEVVQSEPLADKVLESRVQAALRRSPIVQAFEVGVDAQRGKITLEGDVDSFTEKAEASDVALGVAGVVAVDNQLSVTYPLPLVQSPYLLPYSPYLAPDSRYVPAVPLGSDPQISWAIRDQIYWSPLVSLDRVSVEVKNGVATLTGAVDTWQAYVEASDCAYRGGAIRVNNRITVR